MHPFPDEEERRAEVTETLAPRFDLAEAAFNVWLTHPKDRWIAKSSLPSIVVNLAIALDVQACSLFRSVIEECRRCEGFNAGILARSLFETILAQQFVLSKRVTIVVEPAMTKSGSPKMSGGKPVYCAKPPRRGMPRNRSHLLTREQRARIYLANDYLELMRDVKMVGEYPGQKRAHKRLTKLIDQNIVKEYEAEIGPMWFSVLQRHPHTYSGLSVEMLTKVLRPSLHNWYRTIYRAQSRIVHGNIPLRRLFASDGETLNVSHLSSTLQVRQSLQAATTLFMMNIELLQEHVGFGLDMDIANDSLRRRFYSLAGA
jgi:hypothetical protein